MALQSPPYLLNDGLPIIFTRFNAARARLIIQVLICLRQVRVDVHFFPRTADSCE
jgi:hypothetical protein